MRQRACWWLRQEIICLQCGRPGFDTWVGNIPWMRDRLSTPISLPGESHGQRSLAGYSPWGCKESDTTEQLSLDRELKYGALWWTRGMGWNESEEPCVYIWLIHVDKWQKPAKYYKAIILQLKTKFLKNMKRKMSKMTYS